MARLIDTSLRLLSQEPLEGRVPTARLLEVATALDRSGYHALEVTGGGCFRAAVARGVESPWERIRAIKQRATRTPLAMALRGTFLVSSQPAAPDLVRRFILCAAESGIDIFRLHDPLNDADDLAAAAGAVREAGGRLYAGLVYADGPGGDDFLVERAKALGALGADRVLLHDQAGSLDAAGVGDLVTRLREAAGVPVGLYVQGPGGTALAVAVEAARAGADPIAAAAYPVAVPTHRASSELLAQTLDGIGFDSGIDQFAAWEAALLVDQALGAGESLPPPLSAHVSLLAAVNRVPAGLVASAERHLAEIGASDRMQEVLAEVSRIRDELGRPPLAPPVGLILMRQAIDHVLSGRRWTGTSEAVRSIALGEWGQTPGPVDLAVRALAESQTPRDIEPADFDEASEEVGQLATSEEELCLVALFGEAVVPLLERMRNRQRTPDRREGEPAEEARIRRLVTLLEESGLSELTIEEDGTRITLRKEEERIVPVAAAAPPAAASAADLVPDIAPTHLVVVESPMVGTFYLAPTPDDPPFVSVGDQVTVGQTLCILEAMKLFNELKCDVAGVVRRVLVENAAAVEYGQPLFELEPVLS